MTACAPSSSRASAHRAPATSDRDRPPGPRELDESRAHAARRAGDEHGLASGDVGSREHALRGDVRAAEGGELGIGERGLDDVRVLRRDRAVLGEPPVAAVADVVHVGETGPRVVVDAEVDHHSLTRDGSVDAVADRGDAPGDVRALDQRELEPPAPPPRRHRTGVVLGSVGALAHPDVGVVDAARGHPHQHLAGGGGRCGHVLAVPEHLRTSVSGQQHRAHRRRHVAHRRPVSSRVDREGAIMPEGGPCMSHGASAFSNPHFASPQASRRDRRASLWERGRPARMWVESPPVCSSGQDARAPGGARRLRAETGFPCTPSCPARRRLLYGSSSTGASTPWRRSERRRPRRRIRVRFTRF